MALRVWKERLGKQESEKYCSFGSLLLSSPCGTSTTTAICQPHTCILSKTASTALLHLTSAATHSFANPLSAPPAAPLSSGAMTITLMPLKHKEYYLNAVTKRVWGWRLSCNAAGFREGGVECKTHVDEELLRSDRKRFGIN